MNKVGETSASSFVLVYGNHGRAPHHIEDFIMNLMAGFSGLNRKLLLSEHPVPGKINILIERFDSAFMEQIREMHKREGGRFVILATEFITGDTFNDFGAVKVQWGVRIRARLRALARGCIRLIPAFLRSSLISIFPSGYLKAKSKLLNAVNHGEVVQVGDYRRLWKERYLMFSKVADVAEQIWCISPNQIEPYRKLFGDRAKIFPLAGWSEEPLIKSDEAAKDIDFLFSGRMTPYRSNLLNALERRGYRVVVGPSNWPESVRRHYLQRTKICLHLKQSSEWAFPSDMRFHYLLTMGCLIVAERSDAPCFTSKFLIETSSIEFLATCEKEFAAGRFTARGAEACRSYFLGTADKRAMFKDLIEALEQGAQKDLSRPASQLPGHHQTAEIRFQTPDNADKNV